MGGMEGFYSKAGPRSNRSRERGSPARTDRHGYRNRDALPLSTVIASSFIGSHVAMFPIVPPGKQLKREIEARGLSANRLALALGVPSGHITDILNGRRSITVDTAVRLGRYFSNRPRFCSPSRISMTLPWSNETEGKK